MQGLYVHDKTGWQRPKSKKQVRELIAAEGPGRIEVEATSVFGNEFGGPLSDLLLGDRVTFVGPDPYTSRKFYGTIEHWAPNQFRVK